MISEKDFWKMTVDNFVYGMSCIKTGTRKWYNPMKYIKGIVYHKHISPKKMYKEPK
jgi:hypothetical protein